MRGSFIFLKDTFIAFRFTFSFQYMINITLDDKYFLILVI